MWMKKWTSAICQVWSPGPKTFRSVEAIWSCFRGWLYGITDSYSLATTNFNKISRIRGIAGVNCAYLWKIQMKWMNENGIAIFSMYIINFCIFLKILFSLCTFLLLKFSLKQFQFLICFLGWDYTLNQSASKFYQWD